VKIHLDNEIYLVSNLADEIKKKLFINNFNSLEEAFSNVLKKQGEKAKILVIPYGGSTLPNYKVQFILELTIFYIVWTLQFVLKKNSTERGDL